MTDGDLIAVFDVDHVPARTFLRETVGFFSDDKIGFVQMLHHFYNADVFQHNLHLDRELVHEQDLFFKVMLPGRQRTDSVMFAGSTAVLRRTALLALLAAAAPAAANAQSSADHQYTSADIEAGSRLYSAQCALCHGPKIGRAHV